MPLLHIHGRCCLKLHCDCADLCRSFTQLCFNLNLKITYRYLASIVWYRSLNLTWDSKNTGEANGNVNKFASISLQSKVEKQVFTKDLSMVSLQSDGISPSAHRAKAGHTPWTDTHTIYSHANTYSKEHSGSAISLNIHIYILWPGENPWRQ